jgi:hypothetical protein
LLLGVAPLSSLAVMTVTPLNGTLPMATPSPNSLGQQTYYYLVQGLPTPSPSPTSIAPAFLDPSITGGSLDLSKSMGYSGNYALNAIDNPSLKNAVGVNIWTTAQLAPMNGANPAVLVQIAGTSTYVPIAAVGALNASYQNVQSCNVSNNSSFCQALNINQTITTLNGVPVGNAPYYAAPIQGQSFSVYFYPADICKDANAKSVVINACEPTMGAVADPGVGSTSLSLKFIISHMSGPGPSASPTGAPIDSTQNAIQFQFQKTASTFNCPNLGALTIKPDDGQIYIDNSIFSLFSSSGSLAPLRKFIVVGQDQGGALPGATPPVLASTFQTANSLASSGAAPNSLFFATGFTNSDQTHKHNYYLGFMLEDAAGVIVPPSPAPSSTPSFPPVAGNLASQSCNSLGPVQTAAVYGFLPHDNRCFIATAAFGSYDAGPVILFRQFRDQVLLKVPVGRAFVSAYYAWSPSAADWLKQHGVFRAFVLLWLFYLEVFAWLCLHPFVFGFLILGGLGWAALSVRSAGVKGQQYVR